MSRAALGVQAQEYAEDRRRARAFTSLPAVSGDLRSMLQAGAAPQGQVAAPHSPAPNIMEIARDQMRRFMVLLLVLLNLKASVGTDGDCTRRWPLC